MIDFTLSLDVVKDLSKQEESEARAYAADVDALGIDSDLAPAKDAPFEDVLARLVMFAPEWLFSREWVSGWIVEPIQQEA